jgi:hypothetical protein
MAFVDTLGQIVWPVLSFWPRHPLGLVVALVAIAAVAGVTVVTLRRKGLR